MKLRIVSEVEWAWLTTLNANTQGKMRQTTQTVQHWFSNLPRWVSRLTLWMVLLWQYSAVCGAQQDSIADKNICGPLALTAAAEYVGRPDLFEKIFIALPPNGTPRTLLDLQRAANDVGLHSKAVRWKRASDIELRSPAIIRLNPSARRDLGHFVLLLDSRNDTILMLDPPLKPQWIPSSSLFKSWNGVALCVASNDGDLPTVSDGLKPLISLHWLAVIIFIVCGLSLAARGKSDIYIGGAMSCFVLAVIAAFGRHDGKHDVPEISVEPSHQIVKVAATTENIKPIQEFVYKVRNGLHKTVNIKQLETSCGCAAPSLSAKSIPPGGIIDVGVKISTTDKSVQNFRITLVFEGNEHRQVSLLGTILTQAPLRQPAQLDPTELSTGK